MLKIALGNQARRAPEFPQTFDELISTVQQLFGDRLISNWILTYREPSLSDVEMILDSEEEYETYRTNLLPQYRGNPVIFIRLIEKTKSVPQNTRNTQLEPVEEEPEFHSQLSNEETSRSIDFNDLTKKINSSYQNDFEQILQDKILEKEDSKGKGIEADFKEKVMKVILEQLPLIVSHVEKRLEEKKVLQNQASMKDIHQVQCSGCQRFPIIGARYQCLVCQELNFCEKCEERQDHMHPFVKLRKREQQDFLPQSLNTSQCSIYPGKEAIMSLDQIYRAGIKFPSSLDLNKLVTKRNPEEVKSENELNFCNWGPSKEWMERSQNISQKRTNNEELLVMGKRTDQTQVKPEKDVENFGVFRRGKRNNRRKDLEEEASKSSNEIIEILKDINGEKRETFVKV